MGGGEIGNIWKCTLHHPYTRKIRRQWVPKSNDRLEAQIWKWKHHHLLSSIESTFLSTLWISSCSYLKSGTNGTKLISSSLYQRPSWCASLQMSISCLCTGIYISGCGPGLSWQLQLFRPQPSDIGCVLSIWAVQVWMILTHTCHTWKNHEGSAPRVWRKPKLQTEKCGGQGFTFFKHAVAWFDLARWSKMRIQSIQSNVQLEFKQQNETHINKTCS